MTNGEQEMRNDGVVMTFLVILTLKVYRRQAYLPMIWCCQSAQRVSGKQTGLSDTCVDPGTVK